MQLSQLWNLSQVWLFQLSLFIAQATPTATPSPSPTPTPSPNADVELLKSQMMFLQNANTSLNTSFGNFVNAINYTFVAFGLLFTVVGGAILFFFFQGINEAKALVSREVAKQLQIAIATEIKQEIKSVKRLVNREKIISEIVVDYFVPSKQPIAPNYPVEFQILQSRDFQDVIFSDYSQKLDFTGNVLVLDLVTQPLVTDNDKQNKTKEEIENLLEQRFSQFIADIWDEIPRKAIIVVYIRPGKPRLNALDELSKKVRFYSASNTPISLIGAVIDSAYVAYGIK